MTQKRAGFTLVELLVVITIIGILMGLLIPAVNAAREVARRNQCATNMKNFALGAVQYETTKGQLPGFVMSFGTFAGGVDPSDAGAPSATLAAHAKVGTWAVALLPWLDAQPTYERWSEDRYPIITASGGGTDFEPSSGSVDGEGYHPLAAPNLAVFQCPSNPVTTAEFGRNSFVANNGMSHYRTGPASGGSGAGAIAGWVRSQEKANGAFTAAYDGTLGQTGPKIQLDDFKDGQGMTILLSENVQARPWHRAGFVNGTGTNPLTDIVGGELATGSGGSITPLGEALRYVRNTAGMVWHFEDPEAAKLNALASPPVSPSGAPVIDVYPKHRINGGGADVSEDIFVQVMDPANSFDLARPSSAHVDGVNTAMADGATRFISDEIDYRVYQALMTLRGKSSDVPWKEYVLSDESF